MRCKNLLLLLIPLFWVTACVEEESHFSLPYARVHFQIDINGIDSDLAPFGYKTFLKGRTYGEFVGYGGLLIFRTVEDEIFAYDLSCPYEKDPTVHVNPQENGEAVCPKCGSTYIMMYGLGTPDKGPADKSLQKYPVRRHSQTGGMFLISN